MTSLTTGLKAPRYHLAACDVPRGRRSCPRRYVRLESIATSSEERRPLQSYQSDNHWRVQFTPGGRMNDGEIGERGEKGEVVLLNEEEVGATVPGGKVMG